MLKVLVAAGVLAGSIGMVPYAQADPVAPVHTLAVTGPGDVGMYPAYDPSIRRYAATTTDATFPGNEDDNTRNRDASVTVQATTSDPDGYVLVDGVPMVGAEQTLTGVAAGEEIAVTYVDSAGREADSVIVLPAEFPTLTATTKQPGITPGLVGLTLSQWTDNGWPMFETVVDENGVPAWVRASRSGGLDLKRQPNGSFSESRPTTTPGLTGSDVVEMNSRFEVVATHHTVGLANTDSHDSILEPDGSMVLLAYVPDATTGKVDAVIQEVDPQGRVTFQWDSSELTGETVNGDNADYAHINSVAIVDDGDDFLASFRHLSSVLLIARRAHDGHQPGDVIWKLGGRDSSFRFVDDPYGGPCAQHDASMLPDGDIMMFDNGSVNGFGAYCVDPADPQGPVQDRRQSRLAVYHLDPAAHTATLVRSYAPTGWFGFFMGSAQLLPATGNVMVGWASATQAVATELTPDNTPIWELKAVPSSNGRPYFSYRSLKFDVPDTTAPQVRVTEPARGAEYDQGALVTSAYSCSDTGGSTLQTCGDTPPGRPLDTSTPGRHRVTVTATDGAANTTTVTRHYTVLPPPSYRPDIAVRGTSGSWVGAGVHGGPGRQTVVQEVRAGHQRAVRVAIANAGDLTGRFVVAGSRGAGAFTVRYLSHGEDVTRAVVRGTWRTPATAPGTQQVLRVVVAAATQARSGTDLRLRIGCRSVSGSHPTDTVGVRAVVR